MESDEAKLFIGGITWETTEETLRDHFSKYGDVSDAVVMRDKTTGRPRGFGFVIFSDHSALDSVLQDKHTIDGRMVEAKRALSREDQSAFRQDPSNGGRASGGGGGNIRTKKIFVGGLPPTVTEEGFRQYFENFGQVTDAVVMYDQSTQRPRGFGFISFDTEDAVDRVLQKNFHDLNGKDVEVKRALPKEASPASSNRGGYQNYGSSRGNSDSYENRMGGNSYMQPQSVGFSSYPGYNAAGYGGGYGGHTGSYGGGYGGYGGYGGGAGAFAGHAGGYGGSNAMKAAWSNQTAGYGSFGYGAGYGPTAGYGSGASAQTGQAPGGVPGYGNQAYGGGYGGSGPTGNGDGGQQSAAGSGYMGSGYGENNRNAGYGDAQTWQGQQ